MTEANPLRRIALLVEYDGTAYGGSQYQKNAPTVQGALERALSNLTGEPIRIALAGRTDAGVHALGQVAAFDTKSGHETTLFVRALNALLPRDIAIHAAREAPPRFDPRRDACARWYRYTISTAGQRPALLRNRVWHLPEPLDVGAMAEAAAALPGRHDFAAFASPSQAGRGSTERLVYRAGFTTEGRLLHFDIEANAFLRGMVRRIVAAVVEVGGGRWSVAEFRRTVERPVPGEAEAAAPSQGLYLMRVRYESGLFEDEQTENV